MRPQYEKYRNMGGDLHSPVAVRLPVGMKEQIEAIAGLEADTASGLYVEGVARVLEDGITGRGFNDTYNGQREPSSCRLPKAMRAALETMIEGQDEIRLSDLIVEGAARVVRDRHAEEGYVDTQIAERMAEFTARRQELAAIIQRVKDSQGLQASH